MAAVALLPLLLRKYNIQRTTILAALRYSPGCFILIFTLTPSMTKLTCSALFVIATLSAYGQKEVRTFHDPQKKKVQENYFVSPDDNTTIVGKYKRYYENGNLMMEGNFEEGKKS